MCNLLTAHQGIKQHTLENCTVCVCVCVEGKLTRAMCIASMVSFNNRVRGGYLPCYLTDITEKDIVTVKQSICTGTTHGRLGKFAVVRLS